MTAPRELALLEYKNELHLSALPIAELQKSTEHSFTIDSALDEEFTLSDGDKKLLITFDSTSKTITVDRSAAWFAELEDRPQVTPAIELPQFTLRLLIDHGSLELFVVEAGIAVTTLTTLPATSAILQKTAKR
jgi:sucrose-6-phosphate hydrolase SacC (GH32 family)